jgi:alkaline phosphatase
VALDFAASRDDTLVIVTGDHETGGLRITEGREQRKWRPEWSTLEHTGTAVPVFSFGAGAAEFAGFIDNTDLGKKLLALQNK